MADVTARLRLVVDSTGVDKAGNKLKDLKRVAKEADETARSLKSAFLGLAGVVGAAFSVSAVLKYADTWKKAENQIKTVTNSFAALKNAQEGIFQSAQKTFTSYEATAQLYTAIERSSKGILKNQNDALTVTTNINKALALGGAGKAEQQAAILQLGQALGSGRLQGDEFRSISENAPLIATALAQSLGVARGELKKLSSEGKLTSEVIVKAMRDVGPELDKMFSSLEPTIGQSLQKLENAFTKFIGTSGAGIFSSLAKGISLLADNLDTVAKYAVIAGTAFATAFIASNLVGWINAATKAIRALTIAMLDNPFTGIAVVLMTAAVAFYEFSDSMKVAEGQFTKTTGVLKGETISWAVSFQDVLNEIPGYIGDVFHGLSKSVGAYLKTSFGPDALDNISAFFSSVVSIAKKAINIMIGLWVGLVPAIVKTLALLPTAVNEAFINAFNAAGRTLTNFVNKNRDLINAMIQAVSLVTHIPIPQIPVIQWNDFVNPALGAAQKISDAWDDVFNTDYIGAAIDVAAKGLVELKNRAIETKKAQAEALALQKMAGADAAGYGGGTGIDPIDPTGKKHKSDIPEMTRDLERYADAAAKVVVAFNNARQAAIIRSGEKTIFTMSESAALFAGNADQIRYLDAQKQALADNKKAFDEINLQQQAGIVLTDKQVEEQKELLDRLTKEELLRRRISAAAKASYDVAQQVKKTSQLKNSLELGGFESYQLMKQTLDLMAQYPDLSYQAAQQDARRLIINQKIQDAVDKTAQRLADLSAENRAIKSYDGLTSAFDNFFDEITRKGGAAFKDLAASFTDVFAQAFSDALKAAFDPFIQKFNKAMSEAVTNSIGSFSADGKAGKGLLGTIEKGIDGIFGKGSTAKVAGWASNALGGYAIGNGLANAAGLGGKSAANQQNGSVGGGVGAAIGAIWGPIGSAIGSFIGTFIGGLLGPKSADNRAAANLTASGSLSGSIYGKPTDETASALNSVIGAISSGYDALKKLGGTLGATITSLHIGNRDQSQATLSNGQTVNAGSVGDAADLANDALLGVLKATNFASDSLNKIKDAMIAAGSSFDDTYSALSSVQAVLKSVTPALSDWKQRLQDIDDVFKPLIASTGQYSAALVAAYNSAKTALTAAFDTEINSKLLAARNPGAASYANMLQEQFTRMTDLASVGGNLSKILALNEQETRNFVDSLNGDYSSLTDLKTAFNDLKRAAALAGQDVSKLTDVFNKSLATIADQFNKDIGSQIKGYLNSPTDQLNDLLKSQAARLEQAKAAGADIAQVERLTSLELQSFFKGLSDDALKEVSDFLGLFDQATNSVVKNLDLSRQDLQGRADSFAQFAETFQQLNTDLTQKYIAASPRESLGLLRGNVNDLLAGVKSGNDKAAQDLPDAINKLVDAARATYGNTDGFNEILAFAQDTLAQAKTASLGVQSDAEKQIAALDANNDILSDIRDILQSSSATNSFFQSYLSGGVASSDALLALIQQGAGLTATAANDNASALNITGLIAQSVQPIIAPLATSIDNFTQRLASMPSLQQLTIEAVDRGTDNIVSAIDRLDTRLDRIETLTKKELAELEQIPKVA